MAKLKVEGHDDLVRDTRSNGIVNTNVTDYEKYMARIRARKTQTDQIQDACREINSIKAEMFEIKELLKGMTKNGR
jgi:hypothetical protein|tara:strand:+ start:596 stop:823 length:228 start_codon:yes stop_codon:yes gene_type:complete